MVIENSSSVITLTPCTIIKLYHEDFIEHQSISSIFSSCLFKCFARFILPHMALTSSMRLSTHLTDEIPPNSIAPTSLLHSNLSKLYKYSQETEMKSYVDHNGTIRQYRQSTDRALLAQRKIVLRKKLGEGSFSSVREGFDIFHQHKVAIKVEMLLSMPCHVFSFNIRLWILNEHRKIFKRNFYREN